MITEVVERGSRAEDEKSEVRIFINENLTQKPWFYGLANIEVSGLDAPLSQSNDMWNKYVFANQKYRIDQNRLYVG